MREAKVKEVNETQRQKRKERRSQRMLMKRDERQDEYKRSVAEKGR